MSDTCKVIRVKPWGQGQGDFVEINESDFDSEKHQLLDEEASMPAEKPRNKPGPKPKAQQEAAQ